jgi:hypothetical protein
VFVPEPAVPLFAAPPLSLEPQATARAAKLAAHQTTPRARIRVIRSLHARIEGKKARVYESCKHALKRQIPSVLNFSNMRYVMAHLCPGISVGKSH